MKHTLKSYLQRIADIYQKAGAKVVENHEELRDIQQAMIDIQRSKDYTPEGRDKRLQQLRARESELKAEQIRLRETANTQAAAIRQDVENVFYNYYHANAGDVDLQTMELLKAGVLTESELLRMADSANATMRRLIGKALSESSDPQTATAGRIMMRAGDDPHLAAVDAMMKTGDYAVGGAPLGGAGTAAAILDRWDELTEAIYEDAPAIAWEADSFTSADE